LKPQRRPIWENGDIQITQTNDEVEVVGEDRLQSNFQGYFSKLISNFEQYCHLTFYYWSSSSW
jgi:hypothetical protein